MAAVRLASPGSASSTSSDLPLKTPLSFDEACVHVEPAAPFATRAPPPPSLDNVIPHRVSLYALPSIPAFIREPKRLARKLSATSLFRRAAGPRTTPTGPPCGLQTPASPLDAPPIDLQPAYAAAVAPDGGLQTPAASSGHPALASAGPSHHSRSQSMPDFARPALHKAVSAPATPRARPALRLAAAWTPPEAPRTIDAVPEHEPLPLYTPVACSPLPGSPLAATPMLSPSSCPTTRPASTTPGSCRVWICSRPRPTLDDDDAQPTILPAAAANAPHCLPRTASCTSIPSLSARRRARPLVVRANSTGTGAKVDENGAVIYMSIHSDRVVRDEDELADPLAEFGAGGGMCAAASQAASPAAPLARRSSVTCYRPAVALARMQSQVAATAFGGATRPGSALARRPSEINERRGSVVSVARVEAALPPSAWDAERGGRGHRDPAGWNWRWILL